VRYYNILVVLTQLELYGTLKWARWNTINWPRLWNCSTVKIFGPIFLQTWSHNGLAPNYNVRARDMQTVVRVIRITISMESNLCTRTSNCSEQVSATLWGGFCQWVVPTCWDDHHQRPTGPMCCEITETFHQLL